MTNVKKPSGDDGEVLMSFYNAIVELQRNAQAVTPETIAALYGRTTIGFIAGATVTNPATGETFTANVFVTAVAT